MSESIITLWINSETNSLLSGWNAFGTSAIPSFKQGDSAKVEVHWVKSEPSGSFIEEVPLNQASIIKLAIGSIAGGPTDGYFTYSYEGDSVEIPYNATAEQAEILINGLTSIISSGGVSVSIVNKRTFRITFNTFGQKGLSSCDSTTLRPSTNISVIRISTGGVSVKEVQHLRPKLIPIAYCDSFLNTESPQITISDIDSITKRISISPSPKFGTFVISNGTLTTGAISTDATATQLIDALSESEINSSTRSYSVAKSGDYSWDIYRTSGTSETLTVTNSGIVGFSSRSGIIDLNTIEVEDYLDGEQSKSATIEVEYTYGSIRQTLYQGTVLIVNDLIDSVNYNPIPFPVFDAIQEAPEDGSLYARKDGEWVSFVEEDNQGITQSAADALYYPLNSNPQGYLADSPSDGLFYSRKDGTWQSVPVFNGGTVYNSITVQDPEGSSNTEILAGTVTVSDGTSSTAIFSSGVYFPDLTTQTTAFDPTQYSTINEANTIYYPLAGNPSGFLTSTDLSPYLTISSASSTYQTITDMSNYATNTFVANSISDLVGGAGEALDTLNELATALGNDANFSTTVSTLIGTKLAKASNLSDLDNVATARTNLGLGTMAIQNANSVEITGGTIDNVIIDGGTF